MIAWLSHAIAPPLLESLIGYTPAQRYKLIGPRQGEHSSGKLDGPSRGGQKVHILTGHQIDNSKLIVRR